MVNAVKLNAIRKNSNFKNIKGITLIALVVTILVLLILAGITVASLTGDNGLIGKSGEAKSQAEMSDEKELIQTWVIQAMGKNRYGDISVEDLEKVINKDKALVEKFKKKIVVTINNSGRKYYIDNNGDPQEFVYIEPPVMEDGFTFYNRMADYRASILNVTFTDNLDIPENSYKVFDDISSKKDGTVKAWLIVNKDDSSKYDLYIGGVGGVKGNSSCIDLFRGYTNCKSIDLNNFDTSEVTDMWYMFYLCGKLETLDVTGFDTSKVIRMSGMFAGCSSLINLDVSSFDTKNVENIEMMFSGCNNLKSLDVSNLNTDKVTTMAQMFSGCSKIKKLDLKNFNTKNVKNMNSMFRGCTVLENIDLSSFDTKNVNDMSDMFYGCRGLTSFDISHFDTNGVNNMYEMFFSCRNLTSLNLGKSFNMDKVTNCSNMISDVSRNIKIKTNANVIEKIKSGSSNLTDDNFEIIQ